MKIGIKVVLALAVAAVLIFFMFKRRPQLAVEQTVADSAGELANQTPEAAAAKGQAPSETEASILPELIPLPLATIAIEAENGMWRTNGDYSDIPHGAQTFGGINFVFDGMLQLQSSGSESFNRSYRTNIALPLTEAGAAGGKFGGIHLNCGTRYPTRPGAAVAQLVWHYTDGKSRSVSMVYLQHVRDWVRPQYEDPTRLPYQFSKVIWRSATVTESGRWKRLYRVTLPNPQPDKAVAGVELISARDEPTLIVLAATLDSLAPGARPDDSPDLEPADITPPRYVQVLVVDHRELPIAGAQLRMQAFPVSVAAPASTRHLTTDARGAVSVAFPPSALRQLELTVSHEMYGARKMSWDIQGGDEVPATYKFKLDEAVTIGGIVVDKSSEPIPDAKLSFWRYWDGGERPNAKGEQPDFSNRTVTTDGFGTWQMKAMPSELLAHIGFQLTHPDYLATNMTFRGDEETEKQLRAGTFKLVLVAGTSVTGRVLDEGDRPITNATVWSGRRFTPSRQKATTDNAGKFKLGNVEEGPVLFSFSADGYAADSKTFTLAPGMNEITMRLKPGHSIRGIVQDESGQPVSGVRVVLEDNHQPNGNEGFEFTSTTSDDGRFEWKSAPNEPKAFYIGKQGYEQLRNKMLEVDVDNFVTLRKPRQVEGYVLDAATSLPITKFQVSVGRSFGTDSFYPEGSGQAKEYSDANGHFTIEMDDQNQTAVRVEAKDYASQVKTVEVESRTSKLEFRLNPSPALKGIVVSPDGQPQPGVQVAITKGGRMGNGISLRQGKLQYGDGSSVVTTDENGAFSLDSPPETGGKVFAAGNNGYGIASVDEVRASGRLLLQDYGQIEGTLKIGGAPAPGQEFYFTLSSSGINTDFNGFKVTTDGDGRFKLAKLPAGEGELVRLVQSSPKSWMHSYKTNVTVIAGQTIYLSLGDSGALLKGTARVQVPSPDGEVLYLGGILSSARSPFPKFNSSQEAQSFTQSPEWQAQVKAQQNFAVAVGTDGAFTIDSVPPGSYTLSISASRPSSGSPFATPIASGSLEVTVPENANPFSPIQVGEVVLITTTNLSHRFVPVGISK
jgi:protocatechuate 3,4-dioxygenase beta subunit